MDKNVFEIITGRGNVRTYREPDCYELNGLDFQVDLKGLGLCALHIKDHTLSFCGRETDYRCVKCEDASYLLGFDGKTLFLNAGTGEAVLADGEKLYTNAENAENPLLGWENNITFAAGWTLMCRFEEKELTIGEYTWPVQYVTLADSLHFVKADTQDGCLVLLLDTARFLMVGGLNGVLDMGGCLEIPKEPAPAAPDPEKTGN